MSHKSALVAIIAGLVFVLAACQQPARAGPFLTLSSDSIEDEVGHLTESRHNKLKTVAGQHQSSSFVRPSTVKAGSASSSRATKPTASEAAALLDGPLKGLAEMPLVKELSALILPHLAEALKSINEANPRATAYASKSLANEVRGASAKSESEQRQDVGNRLADAGKAIFGSKSDGSDGLLNEDTFKIPQLLQQLGGALPQPVGNVVSAAGKIIDNVKPLNTINQIGGGLLKGARSASEQSSNFNMLLEEAIANEPKEQATKLFKTLNLLLEEGTFLGKKQLRQQQQQQQGQQQKQQQQQQQQQGLKQQPEQAQEVEIFF